MDQLFNEVEADSHKPWNERRLRDHQGYEHANEDVQKRWKGKKGEKAKKTFVFCGGVWQDYLEIIDPHEQRVQLRKYPGTSILRWKNLEMDPRMPRLRL